MSTALRRAINNEHELSDPSTWFLIAAADVSATYRRKLPGLLRRRNAKPLSRGLPEDEQMELGIEESGGFRSLVRTTDTAG
eukprot:scaffold17999_cov111-Skeletonema_dohrnii-CCMP3373.AAC.2